jgi:hypothetical protein
MGSVRQSSPFSLKKELISFQNYYQIILFTFFLQKIQILFHLYITSIISLSNAQTMSGHFDIEKSAILAFKEKRKEEK